MRTCSRSWDQEGLEGYKVYSCCHSMNHSVPVITRVIVCTVCTVWTESNLATAS